MIDVVLGFDRAYAPHAAAVIASVVRHAPADAFRFILLHGGVEASVRARLEAAAPQARYYWAEIGEQDVPAMADREHFSRAILFRLGLEKHAPADCRRAIYLDSDVIVRRDIRQLWSADLQGQPIGAVLDCFIEGEAFAATWRLPPPGDYFNSGVLLIDVDRVRAEGAFSAAIAFTAAHLSTLRFTDQDALNHVFWRRWARLDPIWNAQRHMAIASLRAEIPVNRHLQGRQPAIVHYTGAEKPWLKNGYHPYAWAYWENLSRTPFVGEVAHRYGVDWRRRLMLWLRQSRARW